MRTSYLDSYWKTVEAATAASPETIRAHLDRAALDSGFSREGEAYQLWDRPVQSFVLREASLGIPTRYEWLTGVYSENGATVLSVRIGLKPGWGYYLAGFACFGAFMLCVLGMTDHPDWMGFLIPLGALCLLWPIVHGIWTRFRASALEKTLWPRLDPLGPWLWTRTVTRNLKGYAPAIASPSRELSRTHNKAGS